MLRYNLVDAIFQGGRNFFGAISVPFLLSRGMTLSDLAVLKTVQTVGILLLEFPSGYLADRYGRWLSMLLGVIAGASAFICYFFAKDFMMFLAAEILLALALSCWSGAYEAYAIDTLGIGKSKEMLNKFFHTNSSLVSASIILTSLVGSAMSEINLGWPYLLSAIAFVGLGIWIAWAFKGDFRSKHGYTTPRLVEFARSAGSAFKTLTSGKLLTLTVAFVFCELVLMPLIFYWQPWFLKYTSSHGGISLGFVFIAFQVAIMLAGLFFSRICHLSFVHRPEFWGSMWVAYCFFLSTVNFAGSFQVAVLGFCLLEVFFVIGEGAMKAALNHEISSEVRASYLSFVSLLRKIGGLFALLSIGYYLSGTPEESEQLRLIFIFTGVVGGLVFGTLVGIYKIKASAVSKNRFVKIAQN